MAKIKLTLDTRKKSKSSTTGLYPIVLKIFHKKPRFLYLSYQTSPAGWDSSKMKLKKSVLVNKDIDIDTINNDIYDRIHMAQMVIRDIGDAINLTDVDNLVQLIKDSWESKNSSVLKQRIVNGITLSDWGGELIKRKELSNKPSTASWYHNGIKAFLKFRKVDDILLDDIDVTFLKNFQAYYESKGTSKNSISSYMRAVRAIYNSAIAEDRFKTTKNPFHHFKVPSTSRTKKRAVLKERFSEIKKLEYQVESPLWHAKNYALIMFNCRGINLPIW